MTHEPRPDRTVDRASAAHRAPDESSLEARMLAALGESVGTPLAPLTLTVDGVTRLEVEGADANGDILVQLVANVGALKSPVRNRVAANMFKLAWLTASVLPNARAILCVTDSVAPAFTATGWASLAARDLGIEVVRFDDDGHAGRITAVLPPPARIYGAETSSSVT